MDCIQFPYLKYIALKCYPMDYSSWCPLVWVSIKKKKKAYASQFVLCSQADLVRSHASLKKRNPLCSATELLLVRSCCHCLLHGSSSDTARVRLGAAAPSYPAITKVTRREQFYRELEKTYLEKLEQRFPDICTFCIKACLKFKYSQCWQHASTFKSILFILQYC